MLKTLRRIAGLLTPKPGGKASAGECAICFTAFDIAHPHH